MTTKLYWGIGIFLILVIGATAFKVIQDQSEIRQLQKDLVETQKQLKDNNEPTPVAHTSIDFTKPPPGKTFENGGHWHNGEWHDQGHNPISDITEPTEITEAELKRLLEEEAKWEALFAAEKEENAKKHAKKVTDYNHAKKVHEANLKAFEFIQKQQEVLKSIRNGKHINREEINQVLKESERIRQIISKAHQAKEEANEDH